MDKKIKIIVILSLLISALNLSVLRLNKISLPKEKKEYIFEIEKGEGAYTVAEKLKEEGVVLSEIYFKILAKNSSFKVGEYEISSKDTVESLIEKFNKGAIKQSYITFPEGSTIKQIKRIFEQQKIKGTFPKEIEEGALHPNTYAFTKNETIEDLVRNMSKEHDSLLDKLWEERNKKATSILKTKEEALILASIVERETMLKEEKPIVASVFLNRLNKRIRLQADSTVVYFITKGEGDMKGKKLYNKHLQRKSPYNTYKNYGLPPKPICNVGKDALEAVMKPAKTDYLYFVADGKGGHIFATTLKEHNKNVAEWRTKQKSYDMEDVRKELKNK